jgi:hypothetical protein
MIGHIARGRAEQPRRPRVEYHLVDLVRRRFVNSVCALNLAGVGGRSRKSSSMSAASKSDRRRRLVLCQSQTFSSTTDLVGHGPQRSNSRQSRHGPVQRQTLSGGVEVGVLQQVSGTEKGNARSRLAVARIAVALQRRLPLTPRFDTALLDECGKCRSVGGNSCHVEQFDRGIDRKGVTNSDFLPRHRRRQTWERERQARGQPRGPVCSEEKMRVRRRCRHLSTGPIRGHPRLHGT